MTHLLSHLWITGPYQEDRRAAFHSLVGEQDLWHHIDCHQNLEGPYTGIRRLVRCLLSEEGASSADYVTRYARALLSIAPELHTFFPNRKETLTEAASHKERFRFYGEEHSQRLTQSLISFLLEYVSFAKLSSPYLMFENVHEADILQHEFLAELIRRAHGEHLTVVVCSTEASLPDVLQTALLLYAQHVHSAPLNCEECLDIARRYQLSPEWTTALLQYEVVWRGQWKALGDEKSLLMTIEPPDADSLDGCIQSLITRCSTEARLSLTQKYIQSVCTSDNMVARCAYELAPSSVKQHLHQEQAQTLETLGDGLWTLGAIPYHYERGQSPNESCIRALLFATHTCFERGFSPAVIDFGQRGRQLLNPHDHFEAYWKFAKEMAQTLAGLHRVNEAEALYKEIRALTSDPIIHLRIAYAMAMHHTRYALQNQRDHITAKGWIQQALALVQLLPDGEQKALESAFHLNALALVEMHLGEKQKALYHVEEAIDHIQSSIPAHQHTLYRTVLLANRGQLYAYMECWEQALTDYTEVIRLDPFYDEAYFQRAKLYHQLGQYEKALQDMTIGMANSFLSAELLTGYANLLYLLGKEKEAVKEYTAALELHPNFIDALLHRAEIYYQHGEYEAALQDYTAGIVTGYASFEFFYNRAQIFERIGRGEEALADYTSALKKKPDAVEAILGRAMIFYDQEAYEKVQNEIEQGLQIDAHHPKLLSLRGLVESSMQMNEQAYQTFTLALQYDSSLLEAWTNRAVIAYEMGQISDALTDLTQALELEENATILSNRALVYQAQEQWNKAIADYTRSLILNVDDPGEQQEILYQRAQCYFHAGYTDQASEDIKAHLALGISPHLESIRCQFPHMLEIMPDLNVIHLPSAHSQ